MPMTDAPAGHPAPDAVTVMTVTGPVGSDELGVTLMHEHTLRSPPALEYRGVREFSERLRHAPVTAATAWMVRQDPYASLDNRDLTDLDAVAEELRVFTAGGGRTIVDNSNGPERDPGLLLRLADRTGLNIVMGSGASVTPGVAVPRSAGGAERYAADLVTEHREGVALASGQTVRPGIIGEIGVGPDFTPAERERLAGAALAQRELGVPLLVHLPGWLRRAHDVLDVILPLGVDPSAVVLCHMDPSGSDPVYQNEVADRGVWLEFDMIGMLDNYPGEGQSPATDATLTAVSGLINCGRADQLLLSHDVGMKTMWSRYGGNGYGFVQGVFLPRLIEEGVDVELTRSLLIDNPRRLFVNARSGVGSR